MLCILRHLPDTVEGFERFCSRGNADEGGSPAVAATSSAAAKSSLASTIARGDSVAGGRSRLSATAPRSGPQTGMATILVQEMLEPELAGLQPRHCAGPLAQVRTQIAYLTVGGQRPAKAPEPRASSLLCFSSEFVVSSNLQNPVP